MDAHFHPLAWLAVVYLLPTLLAVVRRHHQLWAIIALNLLLGWTIIGWIAALIWTLTRDVEPRK